MRFQTTRTQQHSTLTDATSKLTLGLNNNGISYSHQECSTSPRLTLSLTKTPMLTQEDLTFPIPGANDSQISLERFTYLHELNEWFDNIHQIMECYCEYFRRSSTLASSNRTVTVSPLLTTEYNSYNGTPSALNPLATLTQAFPDTTVFKLDTKHYTTERDLPPVATALSQCAALNIKLPIGIPYWSTKPITKSSKPDAVYKSLGSTISKDFSLPRPEK